MVTRVQKRCVICGRDCSDRPRTRDPLGRYACTSCYDETHPAGGKSRGLDTSELSAEFVPTILDEAVEAARTCPECHANRAEGTVVCTNCGYDLRTGDHLEPDVATLLTMPVGCRSRTAMWDRVLGQSRGALVQQSWDQLGWAFGILAAGLAVIAATPAIDEVALADRFVLHLPKLGIHYAIGAVGLFLASRIWLAGTGPLPIAVVRLAALYAGTYAVLLHSAWLPYDGWFIVLGSYYVLLMWLFRLPVLDAGMLAMLTIGLHVGACLVFPAAMP